MVNVLILATIAISVAAGYKSKINTGLFAAVFAYLIGCFVMNMSSKAVIAKWPMSTVFVVMSVSLFYNFALANGTLEKLARYLLYAFRKMPRMLPLALFLCSVCISAIGAGFYTVVAFMAPISLLVCKEAKIDKTLGAMAVVTGASSGATLVISGSGIVFRSLMEENGVASELAFNYTMIMFAISVSCFLFCTLFYCYVLRRNWTVDQSVSFTKPEAFDETQGKTLCLMLVMVVLVLIFPILHLLLPNAAIITFINGKIDISLIAILFSVVALIMKLAPQKQVIAMIPWNTLIMIGGVGMLIGVAVEAGTIDMLSSWIGANIPVWLLPAVISLVAGIMSFFSSALGVVAPTLFPIVPALAASSGLSPLILFSCVAIGAQSSSISPFSSGGSLVLGSCSTEDERTEMFPQTLLLCTPTAILFAVAYNFIVSLILPVFL